MKKIAVLGALFFIFVPHVFTDENPNEFEYVSFSWQFGNHIVKNRELTFIDLNPLFFYKTAYFLNGKMVHSNNARVDYTNIEEDKNAHILLAIFAAFLYSDLEHLNEKYHGVYNYILNRQKEEKIFQRF